MKFLKLFSERQKELRGEVPDVYQYETIPRELRVQVIHIWQEAFGGPEPATMGGLYYPSDTAAAYEFMHKTLSYHYGELGLGGPRDSDFDSIHNFFLQTEEAEKAIDVIELSFQYMDQRYSRISPDEAIAQLNYWFRKRGVGYQFESGQIIRVDSEFIHSEVVKPALSMLSDPMYEGANAKFLSAHEHYRAQRYDECMNDCLRSLENCIKSICDKRRWIYDNGDTIQRLIEIIFDNKLMPAFMESHFTGVRKALDVRKGLRSALESGVPTLRNKLSGHGQGSKEIPVPEYIAAYTLHLTASKHSLFGES